MINGKCSLEECGFPLDLGCDMGHPDVTKCPNFKNLTGKSAADESQGIVVDDSSAQRLPWTGRAFGLRDLMLVSARSSPNLIGLVGPHHAGKTAFLTSLFAHFSESGFVGNFSFAGTYTIDAWSRLRKYTEWPSACGPSFPPHTPYTADRVPSLLHLACREDTNPVRDVLFTDAPGEWFTRWVQNRIADEARGARWIAEHATHFLFFIDREALAGEDVGTVRRDILTLARVLAEHRRDRPIATIWTKTDKKYSDLIEAPIREKLTTFFGPHRTWNLSVEDRACLDVFSFLIKKPEPSAELKLGNSPIESNSGFIMYEGNRL